MFHLKKSSLGEAILVITMKFDNLRKELEPIELRIVKEVD